jgi:Prasinovirus endonuclease VII
MTPLQREKHLAAAKRWNATHPEKRRAIHREWRQRDRNRAGFELRKALWQALKHRESGRDWRSDCRVGGIIGCTKLELVAHIEAQFEPGMSWGNYGCTGWEMDHVKPCASFDLTDADQLQACFHFTNLRPRWQADNRARRV